MAMGLTYHLKNNDLCIYFIPVFWWGRRHGIQKFICILESVECPFSFPLFNQQVWAYLGYHKDGIEIGMEEALKTFRNELT